MHKNYNRNGPSLLQRALEFIGTLTFRLQWKHLRRRGETPNYLYLRGGAKSLEYSEKEFSTVNNIKPSKIEASVFSSPQLPCPVTPEQIEESLPVSVQTETVQQKTPVETMSPPKKIRRNTGTQVRGQDRRDQMPLLFE
jgi:hypothetical protein